MSRELRTALFLGLIGGLVALVMHFKQEEEHERIARFFLARDKIGADAMASANPVRRFIELFPESRHDVGVGARVWTARALIHDRFDLVAEFPITQETAGGAYEFGTPRLRLAEIVEVVPKIRRRPVHRLSASDWTRLAETGAVLGALRLPDDGPRENPEVAAAWRDSTSFYPLTFPNLPPLPE